jgi:hypothetical protein
MLTFYVICVSVGLLFTLLSFIFSGAFEAHTDVGMDGGMHVGMGVHGDISGGDTGVGEVHFPFFSPVVLATFITAFGAGGMVGLKVFGLMPIMSVLLAMGFGLAVGLSVGFIVMKLYRILQVNAVTSALSLIGKLAEVTEPILASGVGEISFSGKGSRITGPARSEEAKDIKRHALVTITKVVGGLYYVREHVDEKLRDVIAEEASKEPKP